MSSCAIIRSSEHQTTGGRQSREMVRPKWWHLCDGDPEDKVHLVDYFDGIARAQKVKANPISILFLVVGLILISFHAEASQETKKLLSFFV